MKRLVVTDNRINKSFILMFIGIGAVCLFVHLLAYYKVTRAASWPSVDAVVSHCQVRTSSETYYGRTGNIGMTQCAVLSFEFTYTIGGHSYVSTRFYAFGQPAAWWVDREYPVGKHFTAYYNPNCPAEAVVEPGSTDHAFLIKTLVLLGLAALCLVYNFYQRRSSA